MDLGLYNKHSQSRGEHGTLIGNWVQETALLNSTGESRHSSLSMEKVWFSRTADRVVAHRNIDSNGSSSSSSAIPCLSVTHSDFPPHSNSAFPPKIFNQTGSHWHQD